MSTLKERAFETMKRRIVTGEWEGGTFLAEKYLSELLQMSKTPIRAALERLEMAGLVKLSPKQGAVVQQVSLKQILDIYELRLALETYVVTQMAGRMERRYLERLDDNLRLQHEAAQALDFNAYVQLDKEFHETIVQSMENGEFNEVAARIQDKVFMAVRVTFMRNTERLRGSIAEHARIRELLETGPAQEASALMAHHIQYVKRMV